MSYSTSLSSGTMNRPGFHDCSGYWATASAAALV